MLRGTVFVRKDDRISGSDPNPGADTVLVAGATVTAGVFVATLGGGVDLAVLSATTSPPSGSPLRGNRMGTTAQAPVPLLTSHSTIKN